MDLKSLKRKELQALCKKHGVPGNSTNSQMIESLSLILENSDSAKPKGCLKGSGGGSVEDLGVVGGNTKKKVTFVVEKEEEEEVEEIARNPVANTKRESVANEVISIERRSTRSHGLAGAVVWSPVIEKRMKKSTRVGTEGVRQNDKPISTEDLTTRTLRNKVVVAGRDEELATDQKSRWKQKKKSIAEKKGTTVIEDEEDGESEEITRNPVGDSKGKSDVNDDVKIERRSTRSQELTEAVQVSPVITKTRKKRLRDDTEGVRRNDRPISGEVLPTRSLRNRVVVVGGEVESAKDQNLRTQERKIIDKKEENETAASKLEEDEVIGRKNLRKRSRGGDFVSDEAPGRRSSRDRAKSEEDVADPEEVDAGRSMKKRKRDTDGLNIDKGVDENIERATRTKGTIVNSSAVESGDVNNAEGQKKVQSRGKTRASKRGGRTALARRSTRSSSLVGRSDEEVEAVKKGKLRMHEKDGADVEFVSEPVWRSRGSPLIFAGLPVEGASSHGSKGGEVIAEPGRRSTRSSSVVGKSDEEGQASKKGRAKKADSEVVAEPIRRSTRASSTLQEDEASLPVAKPASVGEVVKKGKSQKQAKGHGSKGGSSTTPLRDSETIAEPGSRSTPSSPSLLEGGTSLPVVEAVSEVKSQKRGRGRASKGLATEPEVHDSPKAVTEPEPGDQVSKTDDHATAISTRRSTRGSSKLLEDGSVPSIGTFSEPVATPSRMSARSSSRLLEDRNLVETVGNEKTGKKSRNSVSKGGDPTAMASGSPVVSESVRRSTRSHIALEVETSSRVERKKTRKERSEIITQTKSLEEDEQSKELLRSARSTSKKNVLGGEKVEASRSDEAISVSDPPIAGISFYLTVEAGSGNAETEFNDDVDKNVDEIRQSPAKVEEGTSLVGSAKDLDDTGLGFPINGNQSPGIELANEGSGAMPVNVEENVSNLFPVEPSSIVEANSEPAATSESSKELSATFDAEISMTPHTEEPDSLVKVGVVHDNIIAGSETMHVSSSQVPKSSEELSLGVDSPASHEFDREEPRLETEIHGAGEDVLGRTDTVVPTFVCKGSEEETLTTVSKADPEIDLREPDSKVEDNGRCENVVADDEAKNVFGPLTSDTEVCSASHTSLRTDLEEPNEDGLQGSEETKIVAQTSACEKSADLTQASVTVANPEIDLGQVDRPGEDVIGEGEAEKIVDPMTSHTEVCSETICDTGVMGSDSKVEVHDATPIANPEIELEEPESNVQADRPSEDVLGDDEAKKILDPMTSDTEVYAETLCDINVEGSDSIVEIPDASKGEMELEICGANEGGLQDNEETEIAVLTSACESSPEPAPTSFTVANPEIDLKGPDSDGQVDGQREDVIGDDESKKAFDPMISATEVCSETFCDITVEGSESKVEVHDLSKGDMEQNEATPVANPEVELEEPDLNVQVNRPSEDVIGDNEAGKIFDPMTSDTEVYADSSKGDMEQNEATTTISSVMSCKYTRIISPTSLDEASPHSDLGLVETRAKDEEESHSEGLCKTLEVSMTLDRNPGDTFSSQTVLDNEMENCKASPDIMLKSQLEIRECDAVNDIETVEYPPTCEEDLEVLKETWVSSTVSVTVNDGIEIVDDRKDAEKDENELRTSLPMESHAVEGTESSSEELVEELGDAEKKSRISFDDEFSAENNEGLMSPVPFMKSEGTSDAAPLEDKDEPSTFEIPTEIIEGKYSAPLEDKDEPSTFEIPTEIIEEKYSVEYRRSTQLVDASSESEDQTEDYKLCDADVESKGYSAPDNENTSLADAEPLLATFTWGEETPLSGAEAPTLSGNEGLTMQADIRGFSYTRDTSDKSPISEAKRHADVEQLNANSDALPGTSITVNKLTDVEFERTTVSGAIEEMDNIGSLDSIEPDKVDLLDDGGQEREFGELRTDENASHTSLNDSGSESEEQRVLLTEEISLSTCMNNDPSLPKMDIVSPPLEEQLDEDSSEKTSAEDGTPSIEEFPLADQRACQDNNLEEHAVDNNIDVSDWVLDVESNKYEGAYDDESFFSGMMFEGFEQASNADEERVAHSEALTGRSFYINNEASASMDENVEVVECEGNLGHGRWGEITERDDIPGSSVAEPSPAKREKFSSTSPKTFAVLGGREQDKQNTDDHIEDISECAQSPKYRHL